MDVTSIKLWRTCHFHLSFKVITTSNKMEVFDKNGSIIDLIKRDDYVLKTYKVEGITFDANKATKIGTLASLGATESKIVIPFLIGKYNSVPSSNDFYAVLNWSWEGIFIFTNYTQSIAFTIIWLEKK